MENRKLREYKKVFSTIIVYGNGIEISSGGSNRFLKKEQIGEVKISWTGMITIKPLNSGEEIKITLPSEYLAVGEPKVLGNFLSGVIGLNEFKKHIIEADKKTQKMVEKITISKSMTRKEKKNMVLVFIGWLPVIVLIMWGVYALGTPNNTPSQVKQNQNYIADKTPSAYIQSQGFVENALVAPSTAKFPFLDYTAVNIGDGTFTVLSYVDSQNSFGAMVRSHWTVRLKYTGGEDYSQLADISNWQLKELIINDKVIYSIQ